MTKFDPLLKLNTPPDQMTTFERLGEFYRNHRDGCTVTGILALVIVPSLIVSNHNVATVRAQEIETARTRVPETGSSCETITINGGDTALSLARAIAERIDSKFEGSADYNYLLQRPHIEEMSLTIGRVAADEDSIGFIHPDQTFDVCMSPDGYTDIYSTFPAKN